MSQPVELHWRASPLTRSLATCAAVTLAIALFTRRWELVAFVAPLLGVLCSIGWQPRPPGIRVDSSSPLQRCFETEPTTVHLWAVADDGSDVTLTASTVDGAALDTAADGARLAVTLTAARWGRYPIRAQVRVTGRGGLLEGSGSVDAAHVCVFPLAPPQSVTVPRTDLLDRLGTHLTRHLGPGVEYADIRGYVPGDQLRTVNWPVSARRRSLHVTQRLTDRSADVVVLADTYAQPPGPATAATERIARGAVQVVQSALRYGDRAGLVTLGSRRTRWLAADIGQRQFYRILDVLLAAVESDSSTGTLAPYAAVPPGAIVVAFSTLLETEFALSLIDLRKRGHTVIAVDVLEGSPLAGERDPLVDRMWALQRSFMYRDMGTIGVDVVSWPSDVTLDQAMALAPARRGGVRR
ncbi:DUF58 domain-containing protein [Mycolicibacterium litorale]|uniref:DUF58 domain-containing protein n=1 Tax=Mycolicibacterium litorale TaxID=758802 RepID=A0AAD1IM63_9MYCO|nr:DUF58 domain-containing protein [Mycolicibacterium litorale]TDY04992.1 uncharacterized protein (DUF58 family) [Mycolicibacterium litorale]BBY18422.1 hypothetical protein MLIT_40140 [Mycolicibacterium litorale]